jgi:hypothetical protein
VRRFPIGIFIIVLCVVMLAIGWRIYGPGEMGRFGPALHAQRAPSLLEARMLVRYTQPPVYEEEYHMTDNEGVSTFTYRVRGVKGHQVTVTAPPARVYDVSFFYGKLVQDGIWQLVNKSPRPDADGYYSVYVHQLADYQHGERTVTFTNPQYWASRAGQQFEIDLSKGVPKNLVYLASQQAGDGRYQEIVSDFRAFGPDEFRHNVAAAQARIRAMHG